ncbi:hypothetical protein BAY60_25785 [Prauserella muralis]|uniref:ANTAR domain-containing protein n=1 Tax=Prauserella muralis TaxID=588067 RepID=A0A2V4AM96_9PSEU|nr:hypothetical protein BAY60_25785 [Prauserella muralis]
MLLDSELRIRAVNPAYERATLRTEDELRGEYLFDAFPDNPADPGSDGVDKLGASLQHVLGRAQRHYMGIQRYDVPVPGGTAFVKKVWTPVNSPIVEDGTVLGVLHHVEDVTELDGLLEHPDGGDAGEAGNWWETHPGRLRAVLDALRRLRHAHRAVLEENTHLHEAMRHRGVIEQAKGILMAQRGYSADDAFAVLVDLSQHTNIKVHDIAQALIDQVVD